MSEDSFQKRYLAKLTTNLIGVLPALANTFIAPRMLGPAGFGIYNFVEDFFFKTYGMLSPGVTICFFTRLSQDPESLDLKRFFWRLALVFILLAALFTGLGFASGQAGRLWPDVPFQLVVLGLAVVTCLWLQEILVQVIDAHAFTVSGERAKLAVRLGAAVVLAAMYFAGVRSLDAFFGYRLLFGAAMIAALVFVMRRRGAVTFPSGALSEEQRKKHSADFWRYASPLLVYGIFGAVIAIGDRWILQRFAGSEEQGFFSLGLKVAVLVFLVVQPITTLYTRELSRAHGRGDDAEIRRLTSALLPRFFAIAAYFSIFPAINAESVALFAGGENFGGATVAVGVMALYPMAQTYGQLSGAIFFATDQTRIYRNVGMVFLFIGLPITWWLLAPQKWGGLALGAAGIAMKTALLALVSVNASLWACCRLLGLSFVRFLSHEIACGAGFVVCALAAKYLAQVAFGMDLGLVAVIVNGMVYTLLSVAVLAMFPWLAGFERGELAKLLRSLRSR